MDEVDSGSSRLKLLYDLGCAFAARIDLSELIPFVVDKCRDVLNAEGASVLLLDTERNELYFPYVADEDPEVARRLARLRFAADLGVAGAALKSGQPIRVDDAQSDARLYRGIDRETGVTTRSLLAVPLGSREGMVGVLEVLNCRTRARFSDDDLLFLEALSGSIAIAIENARLYTELSVSEASLRKQVGALRRDLAQRSHFDEIVGTGPAMAEVFRLMATVAAAPITVLIEGETGTGKELVARAIHRASSRAEAPFLAVNCAAMPESLLETELFGHRRGAFTGAVRDNAGLFRAANGGVVFLDEVGDMPLAMQAKLLRVLEEQEVVPVGESFPRRVDVRVLSATNRDLKLEVERGKFREDLYYRLAVFPLRLPPLRERPEDIAMLAARFAEMAAQHQRKRSGGFTPEALALLRGYAWPGNVRELRNEVERALALADEGEAITPALLSERVRQGRDRLAAIAFDSTNAPPSAASAGNPVQVISQAAIATTPNPSANGAADRAAESAQIGAAGAPSLWEARAAFEAEFITRALRENGSNISRAARMLGVSRAALQKKMKEYGLR
ncbi:MAG: sigma-54-dependent Fis family transcriptional regulator [Candidatus Binataceae bacterium]